MRTNTAELVQKDDFAEATVGIVFGISLVILALFFIMLPLTNIAGTRDFVAYWAAGQQLVHHANPYDQTAIARIEHAAGFSPQDSSLMMRNPPWALPLVYPLGWAGVRLGAFLWCLLVASSMAISLRILWQLHPRPRNSIFLLGASFAPVLQCITMGQTTIFALLGYVLFGKWYRTRPVLAGACLWLCALKPHLFLAFGAVLLVWMVRTGSYRILFGATFTIAVSSTIQYWISPTAWTNYARMMRTSNVAHTSLPCLSVQLRDWIRPQSVWIAYVPAGLACVWALGYFRAHRQHWDWQQHGSLLLLISLLTSPYAWLYDDTLALPALLDAAYRTRSRILIATLALASVVVGVELGFGIQMYTRAYLWTVPAWLIWVLLARGLPHRPCAKAVATDRVEASYL